jgi:tight adherence protein B
MAKRRRSKFATQLPDMLQLLAGSLRAGYSLMQGVDAVALEVSDPMGQELRRVLAEARLGRALEDALDEAAERMGSADFSWAVMAVGIQREVGGNLAELLDTVADTMIQRERLRREVRSLTAEGRVSAIILGILPVGLGIMMYAVNREYIEKLFNTGVGQAMLGGSVALAVAGFYWMQKIVDIEI